MGYDESSWIPCEVCGKKANWTHHIDCRGMGGSKDKDHIENLMSICAECDSKYGDRKQYMDYLKNIHQAKMKERNVL